ncbi:efflux RND transporter permease subunit [bacterium]|nr:efflux RND transporter permease subunit [candidate division CSSED10-310 bacterium]
MDNRAFHPLPRWSHKRPVTVFMIFVSVTIIGILVSYRLPLEFAPDFSNPFLWCWISYPNSTPEETDQLIGAPLEDYLKRVRGLKRLEITSSSEGCSASVEFNRSINMDVANLEVRDAIDRARIEFPRNVDHVGVYHNKSSDWPIIWLGIYSTKHYDDIFYLLETRIRPAFERIAGVAQVETHGFEPEKLFIDLKMDRVRAHSVDIAEVYRNLILSHRNPAIGDVNADGQKYIIRTQYKLESTEDYAALPIKAGRLKLSDIATIETRIPEQKRIYRINGKEGITLSIQKNAMANTVDVDDAVQDVISNFKEDTDLEGIIFTDFFNQATWIKNALRSLRSAGLWGGLFAAIILFLFLRRLSATLIILTAVPASILAALIGLYFMDYSLNIGTLMGLMLAIGMLVDNSIVVTENIVRLRSNGTSPAEASIKGAGAVGMAITASTLTTIIVFLPLVFASGEMGIWMRQIGMPITLSLMASLIIALSLVPLAATRFIKVKLPRISQSTPQRHSVYITSLSWILQNRLKSMFIVFLVIASITFPMNRVEKNLQSGGPERQLFIRIFMPQNYSLADSDKILQKFESIIETAKTELGIKSYSSSVHENEGHFRIFLETSGNNLPSETEVKNILRDRIPKMAGVTWWFGWRGNESSSAQQVDITLEGNTNAGLSRLAEDIKNLCETIPGVVEVHTSDSEPMSEIHMHVNRELAWRNNISPLTIAQTVSTGIMGQRLPKFQYRDREIEVTLQFEEKDRESLTQLKNLLIYNSKGLGIPLSTLVDFNIVPGKGTITRVDGKIQQGIQIEVENKDMASLRKTISDKLNAYNFPSGYGWKLGRSFRMHDEGMEEFGQTFLLAIILVVLLLGALFESLIHPFTIIISLPFALVGVYWTLYLTGTMQDIMANIGLIILIGIVVNNAIVLVDHINQLRNSGLNREDAIIQAGRDRFRPIIMTAMTTLLGLSPMALSRTSSSGQFYAPLAITVMGGLVVSTLLTLLIIPLIYTLMDELQLSLKRLILSLRYSASKHI